MTRKNKSKVLARKRQHHVGGSYTDALRRVRPLTTVKAAEVQRGVDRIPTTLRALDAVLGGGIALRGLVIVAGHSGSGRSSFVEGLTRQIAESGREVLFSSSEMSAEEIVTRALCAETALDSNAVRAGRLSLDQVAAVREAAERVARLAIRFESHDDGGVEHLPHSVAGLQFIAEIGPLPQAIVIDRVDSLRDNDLGGQSHVPRMVAGLVNLAKQFHAAVIGTFASPWDDDSPARLDSNALGAELDKHADTVLILHEDPNDDRVVTVEVRKNFEGPTGECRVWFERAFTRFRDIPAEGLDPYRLPYSSRELDRRFLRAEIPATYRHYAIGHDVRETSGIRLLRGYLAHGWPLLSVLSGATGTGKSIAAAWAAVRTGPGFAFLYARDVGPRDQDERWAKWLQLPLVVLDDCDRGSHAESLRWGDSIKALIEARASLGKPTLCISYGLREDQFAELYLGPQTIVRLGATEWWHELPEDNLRRAEAWARMNPDLPFVDDVIP